MPCISLVYFLFPFLSFPHHVKLCGSKRTLILLQGIFCFCYANHPLLLSLCSYACSFLVWSFHSQWKTSWSEQGTKPGVFHWHNGDWRFGNLSNVCQLLNWLETRCVRDWCYDGWWQHTGDAPSWSVIFSFKEQKQRAFCPHAKHIHSLHHTSTCGGGRIKNLPRTLWVTALHALGG